MCENSFILSICFAEAKGVSMFSLRKFLPKVKMYFRENLGAPFVIGFQVLLLVAAGFLVVGNSGLANEVAVYAYYLLVVGVFLQLVSFVRSRGEGSEQE